MMDRCLGILFVFLFRLQIIVTAIEPGCHNCECCVDKVCAEQNVQGRIVVDYCTNGCISGSSGSKCYNKCPEDCVTCEQTSSSTCATCHVGKYLNYLKRCVDCPETCAECQTTCQECKEQYYNYGQSTDCSLKCPSNCKKCTSSINCQECYAPYYNKGVTIDCSLASCPGNCLCSSPGVCAACQDGNFNVKGQCSRACPDKCKTCSDQSNCQFCNDGYYNGRERITNIEITDCSLPCRDTCVHCTSYDSCTVCKQGYYGSYCNNNCSNGCRNVECDTTDGSCQCKDGFTGSKCTECATDRQGELYSGDKCCMRGGHCRNCSSYTVCETCDYGYFGEKCDKTCPTTCTYDGPLQCDKVFGNCINCIDGFHGDNCNMTCSVLCFNSRCLKDNGHCAEGCVGDFEGPTCTQVVDTARIVGISVGISSSITIVMMIILTSSLFIILRRRKHRKRRNQKKKVARVSYMNTELQPVTPDPQTSIQIHQEYEDLRTRN